MLAPHPDRKRKNQQVLPLFYIPLSLKSPEMPCAKGFE